LPAPAGPMSTMTMTIIPRVAISHRILALARPIAVGYRCETRDVHGRHRALRFHCDFVAWISPNVARHGAAAANTTGGIARDDLADSAILGTVERAPCKCPDSCHDQSARTRPPSPLLRRRTRSAWHARRTAADESPWRERSFHTVHEAADRRTAAVRPGDRCAVLTGRLSLARYTYATARSLNSESTDPATAALSNAIAPLHSPSGKRSGAAGVRTSSFRFR
jgi:hypothetical protein